ncbi:MAG: hypothetical protein QXR26_03600 [Candidatus Caldarchaeum sp.]
MRSGLLYLMLVMVFVLMVLVFFSTFPVRNEVVVIIPRAVSHMPYQSNYQPSWLKLVLGFNNTVRWVNLDDHMHTVTGYNNTFSSPELNLYDTYVYTFTKTGIYRYRCPPHPWMEGVITVVEE